MADTVRSGEGEADVRDQPSTPRARYATVRVAVLRSSDAGDRLVNIYKFFATGRVFDLTLATSTSAEGTDEIVLRRIAESFEAP